MATTVTVTVADLCAQYLDDAQRGGLLARWRVKLLRGHLVVAAVSRSDVR